MQPTDHSAKYHTVASATVEFLVAPFQGAGCYCRRKRRVSPYAILSVPFRDKTSKLNFLPYPFAFILSLLTELQWVHFAVRPTNISLLTELAVRPKNPKFEIGNRNSLRHTTYQWYLRLALIVSYFFLQRDDDRYLTPAKTAKRALATSRISRYLNHVQYASASGSISAGSASTDFRNSYALSRIRASDKTASESEAANRSLQMRLSENRKSSPHTSDAAPAMKKTHRRHSLENSDAARFRPSSIKKPAEAMSWSTILAPNINRYTAALPPAVLPLEEDFEY